MLMKISKPLEWVRPYVEHVADIVPVHCLEKIIGISPRKDKISANIARYVKTDTGRHYISMNTFAWVNVSLVPLKRERTEWTKVELLEHLAHELAHIVHWEHDAHHFHLQAEIMVRFAKMLKSTDYKAEQ
jgi:hypothetical protein